VGAYCVLVAGSMFILQLALILAQGAHRIGKAGLVGCSRG
jgi:hypothetical protein